MDFRKTLSTLFIDLPFRLRLGIVVLSYLLCLALFARVFLASHNGSILAIPLALSSWMLKWRGALIGLEEEGCKERTKTAASGKRKSRGAALIRIKRVYDSWENSRARGGARLRRARP